MGLMGSRRVLLGQAGLPTPSLDLNYASTMAMTSGLETFSRASIAYSYNSSGVLVAAPQNLILQSQTFDNVAWTGTRATVTANAVAAPDGTTTADLLLDSAVSGTHSIAGAATFVSGSIYTLSVYAKTQVHTSLQLLLPTAAFGADHRVRFDLVAGTTTTASGSPTIVMSTVGSGWYRCSITATATASTSSIVTLYVSDSAQSFTGTGTSGVYIWGAQLEVGSTATSYIPTTTTALYGPRFDYDPSTLAARGLLLEGARTNLFLNSAVGVTQSCTVTAAANTLSFFGTGTITLTGTSTAGPLVGTGAANRVTLSFTPTAGSLTLTVSGSCTNVQLELGAFASSPIVTVGSTVTRAADVATISALTPWFNASAGTLVVEYSLIGVKATGVQVAVLIDDGTNSNRIGIFAADAIGQNAPIITAAGVAQFAVSTGALVANTAYKTGLAYVTDDCSAYRNGAPKGSDQSVTLPVVTQMRVGHRTTDQLDGWIRRLRYYNTRLPDATLQRLTT